MAKILINWTDRTLGVELQFNRCVSTTFWAWPWNLSIPDELFYGCCGLAQAGFPENEIAMARIRTVNLGAVNHDPLLPSHPEEQSTQANPIAGATCRGLRRWHPDKSKGFSLVVNETTVTRLDP